MKPAFFTLLFNCLFLLTGFAQENIPLMLGWTVANTDVIFEGKVIGSDSYWGRDGKSIYTKHKIEVFKVFKGEPGEYKEIVTLGGNIGDVSQTWTHTAQVSPGDEGLFLCKSITYPDILSAPFLLPYGTTGFIEYVSEKTSYSGVASYGVYQDIYKDLYTPLKETHGLEPVRISPNSIEKHFEGLVSGSIGVRTVLSDTIIEFAFDNLTINSSSDIEFDVLARSNINNIKLGEAEVYIQYSKEAFGTYVIGTDAANLTPGALLSSANITPVYDDYDSTTIKVEIPFDCRPAGTVTDIVTLSQSFGTLLHAQILIEDIFELATVSMDDFMMDGNVYFFDAANKECRPFTKIVTPNPLNPFLLPTITGFHPNPITAGTGDTLFIVGTEFGNAKGKVRFSNADNGGASLMTADTADLVWTDTMIKVRMPSRDNVLTDDNNPAGSGTIEIETSTGLKADTAGLEVIYAVKNRRSSSTRRANRIHLADDPIGDGVMDSIYTISIGQNIVDSSGLAVDIIAQAMCDWTTETGIQWDLGDTIPTGPIPDSTNIIRFTDNTPGLGNATATTIITTNNCFDNQIPPQPISFYSEFIMLIRPDVSSLPIPGPSWYFGTTGSPTNHQMDFYSVVLHELGHVHGLKHANPSAKLMYYQLLPDSTRRTVTIAEKDGGNDVLTTSNAVLSANNCPVAVKGGGACLTPVQEKFNIGVVSMFPNPTTDAVSLNLENYTGGKTYLLIFNSLGQNLMRKDLGNLTPGTHVIDFNLGSLPPGIYYTALELGKIYHIGKIVRL